MDLKSLLKDPDICPSVAWEALKKLLGDIDEWEPDTIRLDLKRRGINQTDSLMAKVLGAQTIVTTFTWTTNHDVLFAFALACDGVSAASEDLLHPTPEQLAWAIREITALTGKNLTSDEGFDPDAIDPAIAAVLHHEGWVIAPEELEFCQESLDQFNQGEADFIHEVRAAWQGLQPYTLEGLKQKINDLPEDALGIQLSRLADARLYVAERETLRAKQHASLEG